MTHLRIVEGAVRWGKWYRRTAEKRVRLFSRVMQMIVRLTLLELYRIGCDFWFRLEYTRQCLLFLGWFSTFFPRRPPLTIELRP